MANLPQRKSIRLKGFDYSETGFYFITVCTNDFKHYFGEVKDRRMFLNEVGCMIHHEWRRLHDRYQNIALEEFIVMPNHIHGIIGIKKDDTSITLGTIVQAFKSRTTLAYIQKVKSKSWAPFPGKLWHANYYESIISNEKQYNNIAGYIFNNPIQWLKGEDEYG